MAGEILLIRSADYDGRYKGVQTLSEVGRQQAETARDQLLERGLRERAVILSSVAGGARQTAEVINEALNVRLVLSPWLEKGGLNPMRIPDLDKFLEGELADNDVEIGDNSLIAVTHGPLIAIAKGLSTLESHRGVARGGIHEYEPEKYGRVWNYYFGRPPR